MIKLIILSKKKIIKQQIGWNYSSNNIYLISFTKSNLISYHVSAYYNILQVTQCL